MKQWCLAGAYQNEEQAARAHDSAALKYWGRGAFINFPVNSCPLNAHVFFECSNILLWQIYGASSLDCDLWKQVDEYKDQLIAMENFTKEEYILLIRRSVDMIIRFSVLKLHAIHSLIHVEIFHWERGLWDFQWQKEPWLCTWSFKISWSHKVCIPPTFELTGPHILHYSCLNLRLFQIQESSSGNKMFLSSFVECSRHHQDGRWEARIGREPGAKYHYLGIFGASSYPDLWLI